MTDNLAQDYLYEKVRTELIGGRIYLMSPAKVNHNMTRDNIYSLFRAHLRGSGCTVLGDNYDLFLSDEDRFVPDVMIVCDRNKIHGEGVYGAPDLVVEVLSPSTARKDRREKMRAYGQAGVREYWLVDTRNRTIEQYLLQNGRLELAEVYTWFSETEAAAMSGEEREQIRTSFRSSLFNDLEIPVAAVFEDLLDDDA